MTLHEVYTDLLREIGELDPSKVLDYELVIDTTRSVPGTESGGPRFVKGKQEYAFIIESGEALYVKLVYEGNGTVRIDFNVARRGEIPILGDSYKSAYTIMNTVGVIVKQSLKDTLEKGITKTLYTAAKLEYGKENPFQKHSPVLSLINIQLRYPTIIPNIYKLK